MRLRWRIRTVLIAISVVGIALAWYVYLRREARRHFDAVQRIKASGGEVLYGYELDEFGYWVEDAQPSIPLWLARNVGAGGLGGTHVFFEGKSVSDKEFSSVFDLQSVREIHAVNTVISAKSIRRLQYLEEMDTLILDGTRVSGRTMLLVGNLDQVSRLGLKACLDSEEGLEHVARMESLRRLDLSYNDISDEGVRCISGNPSLEFVVLRGTDVSSKGREYLQRAGIETDSTGVE